jgi:hypothetical protein
MYCLQSLGAPEKSLLRMLLLALLVVLLLLPLLLLALLLDLQL